MAIIFRGVRCRREVIMVNSSASVTEWTIRCSGPADDDPQAAAISMRIFREIRIRQAAVQTALPRRIMIGMSGTGHQNRNDHRNSGHDDVKFQAEFMVTR